MVLELTEIISPETVSCAPAWVNSKRMPVTARTPLAPNSAPAQRAREELRDGGHIGPVVCPPAAAGVSNEAEIVPYL